MLALMEDAEKWFFNQEVLCRTTTSREDCA